MIKTLETFISRNTSLLNMLKAGTIDTFKTYITDIIKKYKTDIDTLQVKLDVLMATTQTTPTISSYTNVSQSNFGSMSDKYANIPLYVWLLMILVLVVIVMVMMSKKKDVNMSFGRKLFKGI